MTWETFLKNHSENVVEKLFPDHLLKNQNWAYLWINILRFYIFRFYCLACYVEGYRNWLKVSCRPLVKRQKRPGTSIPASFSALFLREIFLLLYSFTWPNFNAWLPLLGEILDNMCIEILYKLSCDVINFEINLIFLIKPFFQHQPFFKKIKTKI